MKRNIILGFLLSTNAFAEGYYYPVPQNPPAIQYVLPPAYLVHPQQVYVNPPANSQLVQRGYIASPPNDWANSKLVPLPPRVNLEK